MEISLPRPATRGITIYGRVGCQYSEMARQIASSIAGARYYQLDEYLNNPRQIFSIAQHRIGNHRTFPLVFVNGQFIGGYTDLVNFLHH